MHERCEVSRVIGLLLLLAAAAHVLLLLLQVL